MIFGCSDNSFSQWNEKGASLKRQCLSRLVCDKINFKWASRTDPRHQQLRISIFCLCTGNTAECYYQDSEKQKLLGREGEEKGIEKGSCHFFVCFSVQD